MFSKQGKKWLENDHFKSPSVCKEGTTYNLNKIVNFSSNGHVYSGKLSKFYVKVKDQLILWH